MLIAGHQPNYLPYLGFFHKLAHCDRFMIADTAQFVKRGTFGWIHRNKIRVAGKTGDGDGWQWLSLPVKTAGKREQTCAEAELDNKLDWRRKHWAAIEYNYKKAPHFTTYAPSIREVYETDYTHLTPLSVELIRRIAAAFQISTPIDLASAHNVTGEASGLIAAICAHYQAPRYLSGVHGHDYLDFDWLTARGVAIEFQSFDHPTYQQCQPGPFLPGMCALDALFNLGPAAAALFARNA
jgi:hypothetical protein